MESTGQTASMSSYREKQDWVFKSAELGRSFLFKHIRVLTDEDLETAAGESLSIEREIRVALSDSYKAKQAGIEEGGINYGAARKKLRYLAAFTAAFRQEQKRRANHERIQRDAAKRKRDREIRDKVIEKSAQANLDSTFKQLKERNKKLAKTVKELESLASIETSEILLENQKLKKQNEALRLHLKSLLSKMLPESSGQEPPDFFGRELAAQELEGITVPR